MSRTVSEDLVDDKAARGEIALETRSLSAGFGGRPYLRDVDVIVRRGEVVSVLGANGAGKTTLLMALAGHLSPAGGEVLIGGEPGLSSMERRVRQQRIAVITQERSVFMTLSVQDNIALSGSSTEDALALFPELEAHLNRPAGLLSGGQQQMLAVARAIASDPRVILADELSLGLSPQVVERLLSALTRAARERNVGVVIVEQHVHKALRSSDRVYVLRRGEVALTSDSAAMISRTDEITDLYI